MAFASYARGMFQTQASKHPHPLLFRFMLIFIFGIVFKFGIHDMYNFAVIDLGDLVEKYNTNISPLVVMILPQVHLRKPCYDFTFL